MILGFTLGIIYVVLLVVFGILCFRKSHWVLGLAGIVFRSCGSSGRSCLAGSYAVDAAPTRGRPDPGGRPVSDPGQLGHRDCGVDEQHQGDRGGGDAYVAQLEALGDGHQEQYGGEKHGIAHVFSELSRAALPWAKAAAARF
jgi:hypothetical protein